MKKLLADRAATLPPSFAEVPLQDAKDTLDLLAFICGPRTTRSYLSRARPAREAAANADAIEAVMRER